LITPTMTKDRKVEIWVGITVLAALLILVFGVMWGKGSNFMSKRIQLTAHFQDVRGLEKGNLVTIRGIEMGEVSNIVLTKDYAEVQMLIKTEVPLYTDARVFIEDKDLMGEKQISMSPGNNHQPLNPNQVLIGVTRVSMLDILMGVERLIAQAENVLFNLKGVLDQGRVNKVFKNLETTSSEANQILAENRKSIRATMMQLEAIMNRLKEDSTAVRFGNLISRMDSMMASLTRFALESERADGTLGKLVRDKKLYEHLVKTSSDLDSLISDVKKNPKRYIHVSVF